MARRLTSVQCFARAEALQEAADHVLLMNWTEDQDEWAQGKVVGEALLKECEHYRELARRRREQEGRKP